MKGIFQSKLVILALIILSLSIIDYFTAKSLPPEKINGIANEIYNLEWSNLLTAGLSLVMIVVRTFFTTTGSLSGLWNKAESIWK